MTSLNGEWTLSLAQDGDNSRVPTALLEPLSNGVAVTVPGTVHGQLLDVGLIPDPRADANEEGARWVGWTDWVLTRDVDVPEGFDHVELQFDGMDTVAEVFVDDRPLAQVRNMHRRHRFAMDVGAGRHRVTVRFRSPEAEALAAEERLGARPNPYRRPYPALRKVACNFGWDWGPDFPSSGLWRDVRLIAWSGARLRDVNVRTVPTDGTAWRVSTTVHVDCDVDATVKVSIGGASGEAAVTAGATSVAIDLDLQDPYLWWPHTHGTPHLYDHEVTLVVAGDEVDQRSLRTGIREISLDTTPDDEGSRFAFIVNGELVSIRGLNWIPDSCFPGHVTRADLEARFADTVEAHCNLLRVWGGGTYESEDFYDLADEHGVLVWQDFALACAAYSEDDELAVEVEAEARDNVSRLQRRASLALWCGNNENIWGEADWGWREELQGRSWGAGYYFDVLPRVVAELDPEGAYYPGSPWSGSHELHPNDPHHGCLHAWDVWNEFDHEYYQAKTARFVSEFGYQGPPEWETMSEAISEEHMGVGDPVLDLRQKAERGWEKLRRGMTNHGGEPADVRQWWRKAQDIQADAARVGVAHFRSLSPTCSGVIWWQLNDCWPVVSWSVVDSAGRRKPAWYALRDAMADRVVAILGFERPELRLINDSPEPWKARVTLTSTDPGSGDEEVRVIDAVVPARSAWTDPTDLSPLADGRRLVATADDCRWEWTGRPSAAVRGAG